MYYVRNIGLSFGGRQILEDVSFMINPNEKLGLIGRNGAGKTTLFKVISGELSPDEGSIDLPKNVTIGVLAQFLPENKEKSIIDETMSILVEYNSIDAQVKELEEKISSGKLNDDEVTKAVEKLTSLMDRKTMMYDYNPEAEAEVLLKGLGFKSDANRIGKVAIDKARHPAPR